MVATMSRVPYVAGRRKALARAIAIHVAEKERTLTWSAISQADRDHRVKDADDMIEQLCRDKVLAQFIGRYREAE